MGRKRANGEGRFFQRKDGSWCGQYMVTLPDGTKKRKTISGQSFAEVRDRLARTRSEWLRGEAVDDDVYTLGAYLDRWLESERPSVSQKTYASYEVVVRLHIKPLLGHMRLKDLTADHPRWLYGKKLQAGLALHSSLSSRDPIHCTGERSGSHHNATTIEWSSTATAGGRRRSLLHENRYAQ